VIAAATATATIKPFMLLPPVIPALLFSCLLVFSLCCDYNVPPGITGYNIQKRPWL
jgi:hypothetical protein